jgi:hypothetical protein
MRVFLPVIFLILQSGICHSQDIDQFRWLIGKWKLTDSTGTVMEEWSKFNDNQMMGRSKTYDASGKEVFNESLLIEALGGDVWYIAKLPDKVAKFEMSEIGVNTATFVDPKNDFPSLIRYKRAAKILIIELKGTRGGKPVSQMLTMHIQS